MKIKYDEVIWYIACLSVASLAIMVIVSMVNTDIINNKTADMENRLRQARIELLEAEKEKVNYTIETWKLEASKGVKK